MRTPNEAEDDDRGAWRPIAPLPDSVAQQVALAEAIDDLVSDRGVTLDDERLSWLTAAVADRLTPQPERAARDHGLREGGQ